MRKRIIALLLCVVMVMSLVACGTSKTDETKSTQPAATEGQASTNETTAKVENEEPVSLRLILYGDPGTRNTEFWRNEFHEKVLNELNIDMKVEYIAWGSESQLKTLAASGEGFAYMGWQSSTLLADGLVATLDEAKIDELMPHYKEARMGHDFGSSKYKGEIVAIPFGSGPWSDLNDNFTVRNDILSTVGWDYTQIETYEDLMEAIAAVHAEYPDMVIMSNYNTLQDALLEEIGGGEDAYFYCGNLNTNFVFPNEANDEIISYLESDYFKNFCYLAQDWVSKGYITLNELADSSFASTAWNAGNCLLRQGSADNLYYHDLNGVEGADLRYIRLKNVPKLTFNTTNWAILITKADQEKTDAWMRFFDWMHASEENNRFCIYGIEGQDWEYENGAIKRLTNDEFFPNWMFSTKYYETPSTDAYDADEIDAYLAFDNDAKKSTRQGFVFDKSSVQSEYAQLTTIIDEKVKPIWYGFGDYDRDFPAVLEELKAAGLDTYVAEYARQFEEFCSFK